MKWITIIIVLTLLPALIQTLSKNDCNTEEIFDNLQGNLEVFNLGVGNGYSDDEGAANEFTCSINKKLPEACKTLIQEMNVLERAQLFINGTEQDKETGVVSKIEGGTKIFNFTLQYESHKNTRISCMTIRSPHPNLTSNIKNIKVDEVYLMVLRSSTGKVTVGQTYTLNCTAENMRGRDLIGWYEAVDDQQFSILNCEEEERCTKEMNENPPSYIITIDTSGELETRKTYSYYCSTKQKTFHDFQHQSATVSITVNLVDKRWVTIAISVVVAVIVLVGIAVVVIVVRRRKLQYSLMVSMRMAEMKETVQKQSLSSDAGLRENDALLGTMDTFAGIWERISRKHFYWVKDKQSLLEKEQIGMGNFGSVFSGTMPNEHGIIQNVAIKKIKEQNLNVETLLDFEKEIDMMTSIHHNNIVDLLGICISPPNICIITELMDYGQLDEHLARFAPTEENPFGGLSAPILARMCQQPCDALDYLSSKNFVHRDVSARNCLVGSNNLVKLADFGLSRDTSDNTGNYYKKVGGMVPVKWMSPEALTTGKYTSSNDVWAYGVLCWEVFTFGDQPYANLNNQEVMVNICGGERLERPKLCPLELWDVIKKCWEDAPDDRITFSAISTFFAQYANE